MEKGKAALAALAALCIAAGAGGVYFTTRSTEPPQAAPVSPSIERPVPSARPAAASARPVARPEIKTNRGAAPPLATVEPANQETPLPRPEADPVLPPEREPATAPRIEPEPERAPEPPAPQFVDLVVPSDSVVGLQVETSLTSERARVEDAVIARVTRDVRVGDRVAIPAGARAEGEVTLVERGGRMRDRSRLGIRFMSIVLADGTRVPLETETIYREGDAPGRESAAKIGGGAIGGAIVGGILGGARGAVIGGSVGAGAGSAAVLAGGRNPATLPTGTPVTVRLVTPTTVTVER